MLLSSLSVTTYFILHRSPRARRTFSPFLQTSSVTCVDYFCAFCPFYLRKIPLKHITMCKRLILYFWRSDSGISPPCFPQVLSNGLAKDSYSFLIIKPVRRIKFILILLSYNARLIIDYCFSNLSYNCETLLVLPGSKGWINFSRVKYWNESFWLW